LFLFGVSNAYSQQASLDELNNTIKRGSTNEKLEAAQLIEKMGPEAAKAEKNLLKILKNNNDAKNGIVYLKALLAVSNDNEKAYKAFEYNALKQKGDKYQKQRNSYNYLRELANISPAPQSLVDYLKSLRDNKKLSKGSADGILGDLVANNPELAPQFVKELKNDPLVNIRILAKMGDEVKQYLPEIKSVMDKAPLDSLNLFLKHDAVDDDVLAFAIEKTVKPKSDNTMFFMDRPTTWTVSLDILAKNVTKSPNAKNKLSELLTAGEWDDVSKALAKYPQSNEIMNDEILEAVFDKMSGVSTPDRITGRSDRYDLCAFIAVQKVVKPEHEELLLYNAKNNPDVGAKSSCTYALTSIENPTEAVIDYLESMLKEDINETVNKINAILNVSNSTVNSMTVRQYKQSMAPNMTSLYAAAVILKNNPDHILAAKVAQAYFNENLSLLKYDRDLKYKAISTKVDGFPASLSENGTFKAFFTEITPIDVLNYAYMNDDVKRQNLITEGLKSDNLARSINATRIIIDQKELLLNDQLSVLISRIQDEKFKSQSAIYIQALEFAIPSEESTALLQSLANEKYIPRKNAAQKVLENLGK